MTKAPPESGAGPTRSRGSRRVGKFAAPTHRPYCEYGLAPRLPLPGTLRPAWRACHYLVRRFPARANDRGGTLTSMTIRFSVQANTRDECVEGLEQLVAAGLVPVMLPAYMSDGRWMARAVPRPTPVDDPERAEATPRS